MARDRVNKLLGVSYVFFLWPRDLATKALRKTVHRARVERHRERVPMASGCHGLDAACDFHPPLTPYLDKHNFACQYAHYFRSPLLK